MTYAISARNLLQVKVEMNNRIMKEFFQRHELIEVGIPFGGVIHAVLPLIVFDRINLFQQGEMHPIINSTDTFVVKDSALESGTECVEPIERTSN